jgi:acetyl-CoA C-acetyltransferase
MIDDIVIVDAVRTPVGRFCGALSTVPASVLGSQVIRALLDRTGVDPGAISEVIMGQVLQAGCGQNPARQAAVNAGLPVGVPAMTINKVCGAGQKSLHLAVQAIRCGDAEIVIAGGQDSMTRAPRVLNGSRDGVRMGDIELVDTMIIDGLWDAFNQVHMGTTVEEIARTRQISRSEQDEFAAYSQRKAGVAIEAGRFLDEIVPIDIPSRTRTVTVAEDEHPKPGITHEALSKLMPVFDPQGSITAGNSSGLNDGAAVVMIMTAKRAAQLRLEPMVRIASYASAGVDPMFMGLGPVPASQKSIEKAGWSTSTLDIMEINEAFAAQAIAVDREMRWDPAKINVNGGAIALGHPLAASGCRIVVTRAHQMRRQGALRGLAAMCIGGGLGVGICVER